MNYQTDRHLKSKDGCVGKETWGDMQSIVRPTLATYYCGFGNLTQNYYLGNDPDLYSVFGSASGWTSQTDNPTASPVVRNHDYLQTSSLTILCFEHLT